MSAEVVIFGRDGCHLCEVALEQLKGLQSERDFKIVEVDIEGDKELHARLLERIPVVALDGEELYDFELDVEDLKNRLDRCSGR